MIRVFHNPKTNFFSANPEDVYSITEAELVAEVRDNDMEVAYVLTNSIDVAWHKANHPAVKVVKESRSTSVGDFLQKGVEWFQVMPVGFKKVAGQV